MKSLLAFTAILFSLYGAAQDFLAGRTTGQLTYLEYGPGDDRLGGAKLGYLDTGIAIKVIDSIKGDYKVQLSSRHFAFLPKEQFLKDSMLVFKPYYLTTSWKVWGDDKFDFLSVGLPEKLPYKTIQQVNPSGIMIDIYGATCNTNWITQLQSAKEISNVWYEQVEDDVFRVIIELKHQQHWGYFVYYAGNTLVVRVNRQPSKLKAKRLTIAIDAGHGGTNNGAKGKNSGVNEKDYTLKIAKRLQHHLRCKGVDVFMTRTEDADLGMIDRTLMLRNASPHLLISIHLNSSSNPAAKGVSTYYRYIGFRPLSQKILDRLLSLNLNNFGNIGAFNFSLSGPTEYPNCLVEVAFLSNADDEKKILDEKFHKDVAKKIYKGIKDWLRSTKK